MRNNSAHPYKKKLEKQKITNTNKDDFDTEYEKLNNLCYYKKNHRRKNEVEDYMRNKKKQLKENKIKQQQLQFQNYDKIYKNFVNLEKSIKQKNIHKINEKKKERNNEEIDIDDYENKNEKSDGSIENNNLEKNYYFGCLDVKLILSNNNSNINKVNNNINKTTIVNN